MDNKLIFDLGLHIGEDTDFYLKKGFKVVAIEANPELCLEGKKKFSEYIDNGQLTIINKAISDTNEKLRFYIHPTQKDWSSCFKEFINTDDSELKEIEVDGVTITNLINKFGTPRYMKVDIEGADVLVAKQLSELDIKPKYVSFETSRRDYASIFSFLFLSGYTSFQLINQQKYAGLSLENINKEGKSINYKFEFGSSGLFGEDLAVEKWINYDELLSRYTKFIDLRTLDMENLSLGWLDIHAKLS